MGDMNKNVSFASKMKTKVAELASKALILQAEEGIKFSIFIVISEARVPIELMKEDAN